MLTSATPGASGPGTRQPAAAGRTQAEGAAPLPPAALGAAPGGLETGRSRPGRSGPGAPETATLRARRSPLLVVAGLLCATLGALGGAFAWTQASRAQSVLVMNRSVERGEQLQAGDVGVVSISLAEGVATLPASGLDGLVGRHARVDLPAGSLLGPGSVGSPQLGAGSSRVGLRLPAGRVPTTSMPAGTRITVVEVAEASSAAQAGAQPSGAERGSGEPRTFDAVVARAPARADDRASWLMDIEVDAGRAALLADLASRDRVAVIVRGS